MRSPNQPSEAVGDEVSVWFGDTPDRYFAVQPGVRPVKADAASGGELRSRVVPGEDEFYSNGSPRRTVPEALAEWFGAIVILTSISLVGPALIPWIHSHLRTFDSGISFGKGELLGFDFAILAAAVARWLSEGAPLSGFWAILVRWTSLAGLGLTSALIALVWIDEYIATVNHSSRVLDPTSVARLSYGVTVFAVLVGAVTEFQYARGLREFVRRR
jgi:hypothetical protein